MKEVKFTAENRDRHFCYNPDQIITTRDKPLGAIGEEFVIYDPLRAPRRFVLQEVISGSFLAITASLRNCNLWEMEGFNSPSEYLQEICRLYPRASLLFVHVFDRISEAADGS